MIRALLLFLKIAIVVGIFVWFAQNPGQFSMQWMGYQVDFNNAAFLVVVVFLAIVISVVGYLIWRFILNAPGGFGAARRERRRRKGYQALTQGMVAVAAGESELANKLSRKADALLEEPPLTMLLSAQAAQLNGDDTAARRYFEAMLENEETRFFGLRGLLMQAQRSGDTQAALEYTRKAHAMKPRSEWVLTNLFELSEETGDLESAEQALRQAAKHKAMPEAEATRKRAVIQLTRARAAHQAGEIQNALTWARDAHSLAPDLVPATLLLARAAMDANRRREAVKNLERAWPVSPHPDLARAYLELWPEDTEVQRVSRLEKYVAARADHIESRLIVAEISLDARLWGEARAKLNQAMEAASSSLEHPESADISALPGRRLCRLMARLEQEEHGDGDAARQWLQRASEAAPDTAWVCNSCGAVATQWDPHCGACATFDSLRWQNPPHVEATYLALEHDASEATGGAPDAVLPPPANDGKTAPVITSAVQR
ncbi:heme biosynthesis protein HemY [Denitrobaculum tricleocarpae]|uniref:Heme biosynthesis protein HemY n=1 Tax=Denitrobaculum tricleocarpae TaxID=2591009 RepID=A0A545TR82_9PROT|nr:heme biosynthesis HemY N-terminal domain-containing protein [Denitrobaculum tricleocarpae]TQV79730.1 heme biosynthesis protein HemY [Denitrobaculum tricleocarpae]